MVWGWGRWVYQIEFRHIGRYPFPGAGANKKHHRKYMKVVIIGGGIGGMTMGAFLQRLDIDVVICEKMADQGDKGHAFLMHSDALSVLRELRTEADVFLPGKAVNYFSQ